VFLAFLTIVSCGALGWAVVIAPLIVIGALVLAVALGLIHGVKRSGRDDKNGWLN